MDKIIIEGGVPLRGTIEISGAKNAALPIIAATLLTEEKCVIKNVPSLRDVFTMIKILRSLGVKAQMDGDRITVEPKKYKSYIADYKFVSTMRASICVLGPLLAKKKQAKVSMPGGCVIGQRPVDLHIKGLRALGARIKIEHGYIVASVKKLQGNNIFLGGAYGSSVLATSNVLMAAVLARGRTLIENAACEPEIIDLANFLIKMGAKINGQGTPIVEIEGVKRLNGATHSVIPDRIETGTHILAAAITGGELTIKKARLDHLSALIDKLSQIGVKVTSGNNMIHVKKKTSVLKSTDITTLPYPGFPTDMQAQMMALLSVSEGISVLTEKIFPDRFMHVSELNRMGANIFLEGASAIVKGTKRLSGAPVMASDLRASAALILAGLVAKGKTEISRIYHLDRGYERIEEKLMKVGAKIKRVKE
ncbi:MAG: UDP-N-acetylglucosamine 1-carboxyvinyltransferase [Candidatus Omnitrophota bacterium]